MSQNLPRECSHCHARLSLAAEVEICPACGNTLILLDLPASERSAPPPEVDHRGIELPRRMPVGGIITPQ